MFHSLIGGAQSKREDDMRLAISSRRTANAHEQRLGNMAVSYTFFVGVVRETAAVHDHSGA
jgi:hypothetical protein